MKITRPYFYLRVIEVITVLSAIGAVCIANARRSGSLLDALSEPNTVTAIATVATVAFLYLAWKQGKYAADDADRPHISIMIRLHPDSYRILVIANTGKSVALNTRLRLHGVKDGLELETPPGDRTGKVLRLLDNPLFTGECDLPTDWVYEFLMQRGKAYTEDIDEQKYPRRFSIDVSFESLGGTKYEYTIPIDINTHKNSIVPMRSTSGRLEVISKEWLPVVMDIKSELGKIRNILAQAATHYEDNTPIDAKGDD
ncbi:MAG: hypothetical protein J0I17_09130 ['Candidatus Kapabacteria' thiocyanatum]|uniref:Uncharacterized protein n=1 Tax=Candidatus Kapaibacterium thiocyanatum TaxID=1895771 RepID=A0A1M3KZ01_9BACT|nr:hypothetical protein ['Candidatus Kapabacteria' thiocyanatum]OJX57727.1 MAG: hypothetical protein BGO89_07075 ['Candidatus Kapabacteria' thiocyanatum]